MRPQREFGHRQGGALHYENLAFTMREIDCRSESREEYRALWIITFAGLYARSDERERGRIEEMCEEFDSRMRAVRREAGLSDEEARFAGMTREQLRSFLLGLRVPTCDLARSAMNELVATEKKKTADLARRRVGEILSSREPGEEKHKKAAAFLRALEKIHLCRPVSFRLLNPLLYYRERRAIADLCAAVSSSVADPAKMEALMKSPLLLGTVYASENERITAYCARDRHSSSGGGLSADRGGRAADLRTARGGRAQTKIATEIQTKSPEKSTNKPKPPQVEVKEEIPPQRSV